MNHALTRILIAVVCLAATGGCSLLPTKNAISPPSPAPMELAAENYLESETTTDRIALNAMPSSSADSVYLAVLYSGSDTLAIAPGESLVLLIDGERVALSRAPWLYPPSTRVESARYSAPATLISRLAASRDVRVTVSGRRRSSHASFRSANFAWFRTYAAAASARGAASASSGGGCGGSCPVHVRGYTRKDGTYVRPHTRSRPRRN